MRSVAVALVGLVAFSGAAAAQEKQLPEAATAVLDKAKEFTLYSLEPLERAEKDKSLHGWKVLGQTPVKAADTRSGLLDTVKKNVAGAGRDGIKCFDPRHAIRAAVDGKTVDLVICFECGWVYVYVDGKDAGRIIMLRDGQPGFDQILKAAGVPLAKSDKK